MNKTSVLSFNYPNYRCVTGTLKKSIILCIDCKTGETIARQVPRNIENAEFEIIDNNLLSK